MLRNWCSIPVLLVLLELVNLLNGRPQPIKQGNINSNNTTVVRRTKRNVDESTDLGRGIKPKERILNTNNRRGPISFEEFSEQEIIFPDSFETIFEPLPRIDGTPKCADGSTFCENFDSYPYQHLKDLLRMHNVKKEYFFGKDEIELEQRIGVEDETFICGSISRIVFPKIGKNRDKEWKYIVNLGKNDEYVQGVRIETCRNMDRPCDIIGELPNGYSTACRQKYIYRRLMSLNANGAPVPDTFELPSACCCSYRRDVDFLSRFGREMTLIK